MYEEETYQYLEEAHGNGMFFYTDCGNRMYRSDRNIMAYHGCYCPKCLNKGKFVVLYLRGTREANNCLKKEI